MDQRALASLYKHFIAADAVRQFLFVQAPDSHDSAFPKELRDEAQEFSSMLRLQVFYSLLYVVVEGYREIGCKDDAVDKLLSNADYIDAMRRFRNANFHYQEDPFSPKLIEFLDSAGSEDWVQSLYVALENFLESALRVNEILVSLRSDAT